MNKTQIAQRSEEQNAPLLLKFRVNSRYTERISDILEVRNRSRKEEYELAKTRVKKVGVDEAFVYDRTDATGVKQADTGTEMFHVGKNGNALTFVNLVEDMKEVGYNLIDVYSFQKESDRMSFICFSFDKSKTDGFPRKVYDLLKELCKKSWEHTHIWDNPNGSITINAAHIMPDNQQAPTIRMAKTNGHKELGGTKVDKEGIYFTIRA